MKSKYQFSYYTRIVVTLIVYAIFFAFVIYNIFKSSDNGAKLFNVLILILGLLATLYEFLRINYDAATKRLVNDDKAQECLKLIERVEKFDLFKTFKTSCQMMRILALIDLRKHDELIDYTNDLNKQDITDYDVNLVNAYGQMIAYGEKDQRGKSNEAFKKLISIRDTTNKKGRRYKGSYYFNWEVVNGQHKNYDGDYQGAYNYLKNVSENNMNRREVISYLSAKLLAAKKINDLDTYNEIKSRLDKLIINNKITKDYINQI